jgi:hypothetical protein
MSCLQNNSELPQGREVRPAAQLRSCQREPSPRDAAMHVDLPKRSPYEFELNAEYLATYRKWRNGVLLIYGSVFLLALVAEQFVVKSSVGDRRPVVMATTSVTPAGPSLFQSTQAKEDSHEH